MRNKGILIYFNGGDKDNNFITFSTKENAVNRLSIEQIDFLIHWFENGSMAKKVDCVNGKKYCLFKQNINYVEIREE